MTILPLAYLGSTEYFARLLRGGCTIDIHENYVKRSCRNRAEIMTANGVLPLSVHLCSANRPRTPMRDMRIDYSKRWQHVHWTAIVSAYKSSPYFDYYAPSLEPFYRREWKYLADYDIALTQTLLRLMGVSDELPLSEHYVEAQAGDTDLRPKRKDAAPFEAAPYYQLFIERYPFTPALSAIDLLLCEGPNAKRVLEASRM